jgi:hypothetical protein
VKGRKGEREKPETEEEMEEVRFPTGYINTVGAGQSRGCFITN